MSFNINQGLFQLDFTDFHAILGVPIQADSRQIRKRYMRIAKNLHPDSSSTETPEDKQQASQILSKLVNPAYEKLSQEKDYKEYMVMLRLKGQQAAQQNSSETLQSESAKQLVQAKDVEVEYQKAMEDLATQQYQSLSDFSKITGEISELNMVYLMRAGSSGAKPASKPKAAPPPPKGGQAAPPPAPKVEKKSPVDGYYGRAKELTEKGNFPKAILELRDALKLEPTNSDCHSLMGLIYLKQGQKTMAKVHINKALEGNPQHAEALDLKKKLEAFMKKSTNTDKTDQKASQGIKIFGITIGGGKKK
ncbi:DnaJ domain-containing protein [Roseofilum sp. BLCC_M91]|uniref:DnaJ domain-containing protein n=1 Tax=Roseofilum halophilum BLCC-M91 TaxID=3022259 RepID=A0ABT7BKQ5_9CYAN|nr:DnaJ domain-containing protein [Roseofilum halophilum]MDJ1179771.1 DnaJ domain-containing protein [Roseofilum halophilum BLCC-M91]